METEVHLKTRTVVDKRAETFSIDIESDMNPDGSFTPTVFRGQILETPSIVDNVDGNEGELMLSYTGDSAGRLNTKGDIIIEPDGDDADLYSLGDTDNSHLMYEQKEEK